MRVSAWVLLLVTGCEAEPPNPQVSYYPFSIDLGVVRPDGQNDPEVRFSLVNENDFPIRVTDVRFSQPLDRIVGLFGIRRDRASGALQSDPTLPRDDFRVRFGVRPPELTPRETWEGGVYEGTVAITYSGTSRVSAQTNRPDPSSAFEVTEELSVRIELQCDNDEDGFENFACGGLDCDDQRPNINPGAEELCNGIDDNCNGRIDEGCFEGIF